MIGATAAAGVAIFGLDRLAGLVPFLAGQGGALVAIAFVALPLWLGRWRGLRFDVLGVEGGPLGRGVLLGLLASLVVLPPFALAFDRVQTGLLQRPRGSGPGLHAPGLEYQGRPDPVPGRVAVYEERQGLAVENHLGRPAVVRPACTGPGCAEVPLAPGSRTVLRMPAQAAFTVHDARGGRVPVVAGETAVLHEQPVRATPGLGWLFWLLLGQLVVVAVPEEMFFRGYVLRRLRQAMPPARRVLGVPFGAAHVLSAALFAAIHLVAVPEPHRLAVFFPGLLFAWLAERGGSVAAPAVHHALANATLQVLHRLY